MAQNICLRKVIALQNALRYNFAQLSPARFNEFRDKNFFLMLFARTFSDRLKFRKGQQLTPCSAPPATTALAGSLALLPA